MSRLGTAMLKADFPFTAMEGDPAFNQPKLSIPVISRKVLTITKLRNIIKLVIKYERVVKMALNKNNKLNNKQYFVVALLTIAAINGITEFLGGGLRDTVVAAFMAALLFVIAIGE